MNKEAKYSRSLATPTRAISRRDREQNASVGTVYSLSLTARSAAEHLFVNFLIICACVNGTALQRFAADITKVVNIIQLLT